MNTSMGFGAMLWAFGIATMFILWAPVGAVSGLSSAWLTLLVLAGSMVGGGVPALWGVDQAQSINPKIALLVFALGVVNGVGMHFYPIKITDPEIPRAAFMTIVIVSMVIMTALFTSLLMWQLPSLRLIIGICVMLVGIVIAIG